MREADFPRREHMRAIGAIGGHATALRRAKPGLAQSVRMLRIARQLIDGGTLTTHWIRVQFDVSQKTAEADMRLVRSYLPVIELVRRDLDGRKRGTTGYKALKLTRNSGT